MTTPLRIDKGDNLIAHAVRLLEAAVKAKDAISVSKIAAALILLSGIRTGSLLTGNIAVRQGSTSHSVVFKELPSKKAVETPLLCEAKLFVKAANEMKRMQGEYFTPTEADANYKKGIALQLKKMVKFNGTNSRDPTPGDARWIFIAICYKKHSFQKTGITMQEFANWISKSGKHDTKFPDQEIGFSGKLAIFPESVRTPLPLQLEKRVARRGFDAFQSQSRSSV